MLSDDESIEDNDEIGIESLKTTQFNTLETEEINNEFKTYREEWKKFIENEKTLKQINRVQVSTRSARRISPLSIKQNCCSKLSK